MTDLREEIDSLLDQINSHELRLDGKRMRLGFLLREAEVSGKWKDWGFERLSLYIAYVGNKINRQKSQVYAILSVATDLHDHISEEALEEIGITKAQELRRFVKEGRRLDVVIPDSDLTLAQYAALPKVTAAQLRVQVNRILHCEEAPRGPWYDFGGCYLTPDERKTWERAEELALKFTDVKLESSEHELRRAARLAIAQEVIGSWEPQMNGGNGGLL